jgi:hypothetical protein
MSTEVYKSEDGSALHLVLYVATYSVLFGLI